MKLDFQPIAKGATVEIIASIRPDVIGARMKVARFIQTRGTYLLYPMAGHEFTFDAWETKPANVRIV